MPLYRTQNISQDKLLGIAANLLDKAFFDTGRALAKRRYQALERGNRVFLINVKMEEGGELQVDLRLDRTELRGKLNFSTLRDMVGQLLAAIAQQLKVKQSLPAFSTADSRRWSYLLPAIHCGAEGEDVLILGMDLRHPGVLTIELLFIDPAQFQSQTATAV
jgi:hypothetical protein